MFSYELSTMQMAVINICITSFSQPVMHGTTPYIIVEYDHSRIDCV